MKVGVLTFHRCINYGSYWQTRCLAEGLRARGHEVEVLDHECGLIARAELNCALQPKMPARTPRNELPFYKSKVRRFASAIAQLPLSRKFSLHQPAAASRYDAVVVGSDEVWNFRHPWYNGKPLFFGEGLPTDRLLSYAASFGNHPAADGIGEDWSQRLERFAAISVRDENSRELVEASTGHDAEISLDPCLQFSEFASPQPDAVEDYALVYGHSFPGWFAVMMRNWAQQQRMQLVSVGYSNSWADVQLIDAGPLEFARLIAGSRAVATNFFHGSVFALLNGRPWVAVPSDYRSIKLSGLASLIGANERIISAGTGDAELRELLSTPRERRVGERIEAMRQSSTAFLDAALA
jgi:polysaccharide pyruvyl transferase WcaK-like protein